MMWRVPGTVRMGAIEAPPALVARALARGAVALAMGRALHSASSGTFEVRCIMATRASLKFQPHRPGEAKSVPRRTGGAVEVGSECPAREALAVRHARVGRRAHPVGRTRAVVAADRHCTQGEVRLRYGRVVGGCGCGGLVPEQSLGWPAGPVQLASHRQKGTATDALTHWPLPEHPGVPGQSAVIGRSATLQTRLVRGGFVFVRISQA